jgi:hypothetical protein
MESSAAGKHTGSYRRSPGIQLNGSWTTWLRPRDLASYSALSARLINWSAVSPGWKAVKPAEKVVLMSLAKE